jgi:hypothetical protein
MDLQTRDRAAADVEAISPGQPGVPDPGAVGDPPPEARLTAFAKRHSLVLQLLLAGAILFALAVMAFHFDKPPRHLAFHAFPDTARALLSTIAVFAVGGFGIVRLCLPQRLRRYELLWVLPAGGCAIGMSMTLLGFAAVPYGASLPIVLAAGVALAVYAVRTDGWPSFEPAELAWPVFLAFVVFYLALVPMLFEQHYAAITGTGSDAHMAAGSANFLMHAYPTGVQPGLPLDRMPPLWGSKFPIYYAYAAVTSVAGLQTWQVLPVLAAVLLATAAAGIYFVARDVLGAARAIALVAMALAGCNRMVLHTGLNPYFNQTWGYFAMPFSIVLGWFVVQPAAGEDRRRTALLAALFLIVVVFAYPLAAPLPLMPIGVFLWLERRRAIAAGEPVPRVRSFVRPFYRGRRSLIWMVPAGCLLLLPVLAVLGKAAGALKVLAPGSSLAAWGGDLRAFIPYNFFLSLPNNNNGSFLALVVLILAWIALRDQQKALKLGLGGLLALGLLFAAYFRQRTVGWYFEFKLLAFVGPLLVAVAAIGAGRLRRWGPVWIALLALATAASAFDEVRATGFQLNQQTIQLGSWARAVPAGASIRLDMYPPQQLWAAYMLAARPLCSQAPLLGTDYPHVPVSRKADYIVASTEYGRPADAIGPALDTNANYSLFRENPAVPGVSRCSLHRKDREFQGADHTAT